MLRLRTKIHDCTGVEEKKIPLLCVFHRTHKAALSLSWSSSSLQRSLLLPIWTSFSSMSTLLLLPLLLLLYRTALPRSIFFKIWSEFSLKRRKWSLMSVHYHQERACGFHSRTCAKRSCKSQISCIKQSGRTCEFAGFPPGRLYLEISETVRSLNAFPSSFFSFFPLGSTVLIEASWCREETPQRHVCAAISAVSINAQCRVLRWQWPHFNFQVCCSPNRIPFCGKKWPMVCFPTV